MNINDFVTDELVAKCRAHRILMLDTADVQQSPRAMKLYYRCYIREVRLHPDDYSKRIRNSLPDCAIHECPFFQGDDVYIRDL